MTASLTWGLLGVLLFCIVADMGRELCFKGACLQADRARFVRSVARRPLLWFGLLLWAVEGVAWLLVLERMPLAVAFPIMALTYAATPVAARAVLGERLSRDQMLGAGLVSLGVMVVSAAGLRI